MYTPENSWMNGTPGHVKNMSTKQLCDRKVRDLVTALRVQKLFGTFEKRVPGPGCLKGG